MFAVFTKSNFFDYFLDNSADMCYNKYNYGCKAFLALPRHVFIVTVCCNAVCIAMML